MSFIRAVIGDILYNVWHTFSTPSQIGFMTLGVGGVFTLLFVGGYNLIPDTVLTSSLFDSFAIFAMVMVGMSGPVRMLEEHRLGGTLEQLFLSPTPVWALCAVRSVTGILAYIPAFAVCLAGLQLAGSGFEVSITGSRVVLWILMLIASLGLGYMIGAFALLSPLANRVLGAAIFAILGLSMVQVQGRAAGILTALAPTVGATSIIGTLDQPAFWSLGVVGWLALVCVAHWLTGFLIFSAAEKAARRRGTLVRYYF